MTDLRKAAEMALEALNDDPKMLGDWLDNLKTAREALRQALAQPEQGKLSEITRQFVGVKDDGSERWVETEYRTATRSEWIGLTRKEAEDVVDDFITIGGDVENWVGYWQAIEAKLKEKNA